MNNKTSPPSLPEGPKLISAIVIIRHGARTPKEKFYANSHWPFDSSPGQLTASGWEQSLLMGELLRSHYAPYPIPLDNNSPSKLLKEIVSLRTTSASRCIETAKAILTGFLQNSFSTKIDSYPGKFSTIDCNRHISNNSDEKNFISVPQVSYEHRTSSENTECIISIINNNHLINGNNIISTQSTSTNKVITTDDKSLIELEYLNTESSFTRSNSSHDTYNSNTCIRNKNPLISNSQKNILFCENDSINLQPMDLIDIIPYSDKEKLTQKTTNDRLEELKKESVENSPDYKRLSDKYAQLIEQLKSFTGWDTAQGLKVVKKFESASGSFQHHSMKLPDEVSDDMLKNISKASAELKRLKYSNPELGWLSGGTLLTDIVNQFSRISDQYNKFLHQPLNNKFLNKPREISSTSLLDDSFLTVYVTHQSALLELQASLGVANKNLFLPDFAGSIFAELIYINDEDMSEEDFKQLRMGCQCFQDSLNKISKFKKTNVSSTVNFDTSGAKNSVNIDSTTEKTLKESIGNNQPHNHLNTLNIPSTSKIDSPNIKTINFADIVSHRNKTDSIDFFSEWSSNDSYEFSFENPLIKDTKSFLINYSLAKDTDENQNKLKDFTELDESTTSTSETIYQSLSSDTSSCKIPGYYIRWTINGHNPLQLPTLDSHTIHSSHSHSCPFFLKTNNIINKTLSLSTSENSFNPESSSPYLQFSSSINEPLNNLIDITQNGYSQNLLKEKSSNSEQHIIELIQLEKYIEDMTIKYGNPLP